MSRVAFFEDGATSRAGANVAVALTLEEAGQVSGGESPFQALIEWRQQNSWLDASMANHGMVWNGEVYVASVVHFEAQGVEPPKPNANRG